MAGMTAIAGWTPIASSISGSRAKTVCVSRRLRPLTLPHGMTIRWVGATVGEDWVWLIAGSSERVGGIETGTARTRTTMALTAVRCWTGYRWATIDFVHGRSCQRSLYVSSWLTSRSNAGRRGQVVLVLDSGEAHRSSSCWMKCAPVTAQTVGLLIVM